MLHVPGLEQARLVPVRVEDVPAADMPAVLRPLLFRDIFGMAEDQARRMLLEAVASPQRPDRKPTFPSPDISWWSHKPGGLAPRLPGLIPQVWNIPAS